MFCVNCFFFRSELVPHGGHCLNCENSACRKVSESSRFYAGQSRLEVINVGRSLCKMSANFVQFCPKSDMNTHFSKTTKGEILRKSVRCVSFCSMRTDRRDEADGCWQLFANVPKYSL